MATKYKSGGHSGGGEGTTIFHTPIQFFQIFMGMRIGRGCLWIRAMVLGECATSASLCNQRLNVFPVFILAVFTVTTSRFLVMNLLLEAALQSGQSNPNQKSKFLFNEFLPYSPF